MERSHPSSGRSATPADINRNGRPTSIGTGGRHQSECPADIIRIRTVVFFDDHIVAHRCRSVRGRPPHQLHADPAGAEDRGAVVADQPAREADQDRREGRQPRPIRHVPARRGRGAPPAIRRNPVADRPTAGTACAGMRGQREQMWQRRGSRCALMNTVRCAPTLCGGKLHGLAAGTANHRLNFLAARLNGTEHPPKRPQSGECRLIRTQRELQNAT
jgi:hypothetical protein